MRGTRAALRYAKAMLSYAQESKADEVVAKDMHALISLLHENNEVQTVLENPILPVAEKEAVLKELFSQASPETFKLFSLLVITQVRVDSAPVPEIVGIAILYTPGFLTRSQP